MLPPSDVVPPNTEPFTLGVALASSTPPPSESVDDDLPGDIESPGDEVGAGFAEASRRYVATGLGCAVELVVALPDECDV